MESISRILINWIVNEIFFVIPPMSHTTCCHLNIFPPPHSFTGALQSICRAREKEREENERVIEERKSKSNELLSI